MKYSIAIPAYKRRYLQECIESILSQSITDFELIIVNDSSPENLDEIVNLFSDSRIRYYVNEKNCGAINVVDNWNKCLEYAKGDFFVCLGDDDKLYPYFLEEYNKLIDQYPNLSIYHARTIFIDEHSHIIGIQDDRPSHESFYSMVWHETFGFRVQFIGDFLFNTANLKQNGGFYKFPLAWGSDAVTSFIAAKENGIANGHIPTFMYRQNAQSITSTGGIKLKMDATQEYLEWLEKEMRPIPSDNVDRIYRDLIIRGYKKVWEKNKILMIASDIANTLKSIPFWFNSSTNFNLSKMQIAKACIFGISQKLYRIK